MTENKRIFLNIVASYGRSLYALVCGLFTARWALRTLGETDYGLYGVVGGLTIFISFFMGLMGQAVGRFYAFSVGEARVANTPEEGIENCRKWFNSALLLHTIFPFIFLVIGYPIGEYGIRHTWLNIPPDRVEACVWVFRYVCISCFVGMVTVPYNAMYAAKQMIAELTVYSMITTTLNFLGLYYMVTHPSDWLSRYALWMAFINILPQIIIAFRAVKLFPECSYKSAYLFNRDRIKQLSVYAGCQFIDSVGNLVRGQGIAILINRAFGAAVNAAKTVGSALDGHCSSLSLSIFFAYSPAVSSACGAGDLIRMRTLAFSACKMCAITIMIFAIPLMLEVDEVLRLWLVRPPKYAAFFCVCGLVTILFERMSVGHTMAIEATGNVFKFKLFRGIAYLSVLPISFILIKGCNLGVYSVGYAFIVMTLLATAVEVYYARKRCCMSVRYWAERILFPIVLLCALLYGVGLLPRLWLAPSFVRICVTTILVNGMMIFLSWHLVLNEDEKKFISNRIKRMKNAKRCFKF